ncbi:MAG: carboxypeptidase regulatory-like domain-containing protein [Planctomycetes bacterium]|nr:carboxypeptidase regulatory-like domain-containing protein [Planctomycetota bacterium]
MLGTSALRSWGARTDRDGRFALEEAPAIENSAVWASATGYQRTRIDAPLATARTLELVLAASDPSSHLQGRVVDAQGAPVVGAYVALDRQAGLTDRLGRFELPAGPRDERTGEGGGTRLRVAKQGFLPVTLESRKPTSTEPGAWPEPLVVVLGDPARTIEGVLVDADGKPVAGARVTPLGRSPFADVLTAFGAQSFALSTDMEAVLAGGADRRASVVSGADGEFHVAGLLAHDYRLRVFDPRSLEVLVTEPIPAGRRGVRLVLGAAGKPMRVAGTVVDLRGRPIAGVAVQLLATHAELPPEETWDLASKSLKTDAEGRFVFVDIAPNAARVRASMNGDLVSAESALADAPDLEHVRIELARPCHARIESKTPELAGSSFGFVDARGEPLTFYVELGDVSAGAARFSWNGETSGVLTVSETARALLFFGADEKELLRLPIDLSPDREVEVLRP